MSYFKNNKAFYLLNLCIFIILYFVTSCGDTKNSARSSIFCEAIISKSTWASTKNPGGIFASSKQVFYTVKANFDKSCVGILKDSQNQGKQLIVSMHLFVPTSISAADGEKVIFVNLDTQNGRTYAVKDQMYNLKSLILDADFIDSQKSTYTNWALPWNSVPDTISMTFQLPNLTSFLADKELYPQGNIRFEIF